jgi:tetratricopeptide (TPR) repeat protein
MPARVVHLFVSSPGDVDAERKRVEFVAERLNGLFAGVARFETIRWETKFYAAHKSFQPQIREASDCDIIIGIFWARLGSELPPDFQRMPNSEPFPSGTAYEILSAIWKRQQLEAERAGEPRHPNPDVYLFQKRAPPFPPPRDEKDLALLDVQWKLLKSFVERWIRTPDGHFLAAFHSFGTTDEFEQQIENLLRDWLAEHVMGRRSVIWPIDTKGSPFCGLEAFDAAHAPVFFGRSRDITRATDRLRAAARPESDPRRDAAAALDAGEAAVAGKPGTPFLLVVGASGAGKSSLVRAGIVPRLTTPGVVAEVDVWRVAVMRPSDGATPLEALATALYAPASADTVPAAALPELADGDNRVPEEFVGHLRGESAVAVRPVVRALERIGAEHRSRGEFARAVRVDLLLVVDQLDDLFADDVPEADRAQFAKVVAALVATGRVWVLATLRAALYERFLVMSEFKALKDAGSDYDLAPPGAAELAEIVTKPAEAAALVFERNTEGVSLDERLLADAAATDTLPLLQFTLQRLYEDHATVDGETRLTFAAYTKLGGLDGAIDQAGEDALKELSDSERASLPRLLRQLVIPVQDVANAGGRAGVTVRAVPLAEAAPDANAQVLIKALVDVRILTSATEGGAATVRISHQRVLESWKRAQDIVRANADFFRVRGEIEDQRRRWQARGRKPELLLSRGLPLAEAEAMVARFRSELSTELHDYVAASGRRARLRQRLTATAAVVFAVLAVFAIISWRQAQTSLDAATAAISALIETTSEIVRPIAQLDAVNALIEQARDSLDRFSSISEDTRITQQRARTFLLLAETDWERGNISRMREEAEQAYALLNRLAANGDLEMRHLLARSERWIGLAYNDADDKDAARLHYERGIGGLIHLLNRDVRDDVSWRWRQTLADLDQELGDVLLIKFSDIPGALAAFTACYDIRTALAASGHRSPAIDHDIAWAANKRGDVAVREADDDEALKWFTIARDRLEGLVDDLWDNLMWPDHLGLIDDNIGLILKRREKFDEGMQDFAKAEELLTRVVKRDPKNLFRRAGLSWTYFNGGEDQFNWARKTNDRDHLVAARERFAASVNGYSAVVKEAPHHVQWQMALTVARADFTAVEATMKQWSQDDRGAADGFAAAADLMLNNIMPLADHYARPNFVESTIWFLDWAASEDLKLGRVDEARSRATTALKIAQKYRVVIGEKNYAIIERQLREHLDAARI